MKQKIYEFFSNETVIYAAIWLTTALSVISFAFSLMVLIVSIAK